MYVLKSKAGKFFAKTLSALGVQTSQTSAILHLCYHAAGDVKTSIGQRSVAFMFEYGCCLLTKLHTTDCRCVTQGN